MAVRRLVWAEADLVAGRVVGDVVVPNAWFGAWGGGMYPEPFCGLAHLLFCHMYWQAEGDVGACLAAVTVGGVQSAELCLGEPGVVSGLFHLAPG
jgi:hypothetical protein